MAPWSTSFEEIISIQLSGRYSFEGGASLQLSRRCSFERSALKHMSGLCPFKGSGGIHLSGRYTFERTTPIQLSGSYLPERNSSKQLSECYCRKEAASVQLFRSVRQDIAVEKHLPDTAKFGGRASIALHDSLPGGKMLLSSCIEYSSLCTSHKKTRRMFIRRVRCYVQRNYSSGY